MLVSPPPIEYFHSFASEISSKFNRISDLIDHRGSIGNYHEEIIRSVLRNFLPKRYSVKTGFIRNLEGRVSSQMDVIIVDENIPTAYLFQDENFAIVMSNAVVAFIEVKTTLNAKDFDTSVKNIASAKSCFDYPLKIPGIIFGYQGTKPTKKNLDNWFARKSLACLANSPELWPNAIFFFSEGSLLTRINKDGKFEANKYRKIFCDDKYKDKQNDNALQLSIILGMILDGCVHKEQILTRKFSQYSAAYSFVNDEGLMAGNDFWSFAVNTKS